MAHRFIKMNIYAQNHACTHARTDVNVQCTCTFTHKFSQIEFLSVLSQSYFRPLRECAFTTSHSDWSSFQIRFQIEKVKTFNLLHVSWLCVGKHATRITERAMLILVLAVASWTGGGVGGVGVNEKRIGWLFWILDIAVYFESEFHSTPNSLAIDHYKTLTLTGRFKRESVDRDVFTGLAQYSNIRVKVHSSIIVRKSFFREAVSTIQDWLFVPLLQSNNEQEEFKVAYTRICSVTYCFRTSWIIPCTFRWQISVVTFVSHSDFSFNNCDNDEEINSLCMCSCKFIPT